MATQGRPVALIAGASSGMGRDVALRLIDEGYVVCGAPRRMERMAEVEAAGGRVFDRLIMMALR